MSTSTSTPHFRPEYWHIPTIVADHPDVQPFDEKVYAVIHYFYRMKMGKCIASNQYIAELIKPSDPQTRSVQNALNRLEECGFIERFYKDSSRRHRTEIVPRVAYQIERKRGDTRKQSESVMTPERKGDDTQSESVMTRVRIESKKRSKSIDTAGGAGRAVAEFIDAFKGINPSHSRLFANKTQRAAAERLIAKYGIEKAMGMVRYVGQIHGQTYAPSITTPYELEAKLAKLAEFAAKQKKRGPKLITI